MKILVIEDYAPLRNSVVKTLQENGYAVDQATNGKDGLWYAETGEYDIVLLDLMLPELNGLSVLKKLREKNNKAYILIASARSEVGQRVEGLDLGADDYLVKPYSIEELMARVRSIIRRKYSNVSPEQRFGDLEIDTNKRRVKRAGRLLELSAREYAILEYMAARAGQVVTRAAILQHVYDFNAELNSNVIDVYIGYLRKKTEIYGLPRLIHTRRNQGYVFEVIEQ